MNAHPRPLPPGRPPASHCPTPTAVVTESGRRVDLAAPAAAAIALSDIAGALARLPVWGGMAGAGPWSHAAQALHAEALAGSATSRPIDRATRAAILLLDARLAYLGAPAPPFLAALDAAAGRLFGAARAGDARIAALELGAGLDRAIRDALGLPVLTADQREAAEIWHRKAEAAAWADLMSGPPPARIAFAGVARAGGRRVTVQPWPDVAARFLDRARTLLGAAP